MSSLKRENRCGRRKGRELGFENVRKGKVEM